MKDILVWGDSEFDAITEVDKGRWFETVDLANAHIGDEVKTKKLLDLGFQVDKRLFRVAITEAGKGKFGCKNRQSVDNAHSTS